ncbi:MAG: trehalose-phosphatase, partial [Stellaceae bacterium]
MFLDIDGTLLPIAATPQAVRAESELRALLTRLERACAGGAALVSGRALADIDALLGLQALPAAGLHGLE